MKKVLIFAALLATVCVADAAQPNTALSPSPGITLDVRRRTVDVSLDLTLDTRIPLGTVILVK